MTNSVLSHIIYLLRPTKSIKGLRQNIQVLESKRSNGGESVSIRIPELFKSILAGAKSPAINQFYDAIKQRRHSRMSNILGLSEAMSQKLLQIDIPVVAATLFPHATEYQLEVFIDYVYWLLIFDDRMDDGEFKCDIIGATNEILETLAVLDDDHPTVTAEENPLRHVFQDIWKRFSMNVSKEQRHRYKRGNRAYMMGLVKQIQWTGCGCGYATLDQYRETRRGTVAIYPLLPFCEWQHSTNLPEDVIDHPSIEALGDILSDIAWLWNDICSIKKDMETGEESNVIIMRMREGESMQKAMDTVAGLLDDCYENWEKQIGAVPKWGEDIDKDISTVVQAYLDLVVGLVSWDISTPRYMGKDAATVRQTNAMKFSKSLLESYEKS
ncbi:hypothetical protein TWF694_006018 [Orbilia ellipsospora]|uniref:Terpene synthase n=1 Tax=Orbilia ellipsospora TaxID=2528407 RepID=A0AAV9WSL6_9PEZI